MLEPAAVYRRRNNGNKTAQMQSYLIKANDNQTDILVGGRVTMDDPKNNNLVNPAANHGNSQSAVGFNKTNGCYVSKKVGIILSVFFVSAVLSTAMLVYFFAPTQQLTTADPRQLSMPSNVAQNEISAMKSLDISQTKRSRKVADESIRLPTSVKPIRYLIRLDPELGGNFTIYGSVQITIEVLEATSNVTLHIYDIITKNETITLKSVNDLTGPGVPITEHLYDRKRDFYVANLGEELVVGEQYILSMEFQGLLNDELAGFYRSQYTKDDGTLTWLATTQFEPTDARRAFPCFDEPAFKAEFEIYIKRNSNLTCISNMPLVESLPVDGDADSVWDHFNTSVPMSTYLVAFVVSDFAYLSSNYNDHVLFRVWARDGAISQAAYALEAGPKILTFYENYFNIPFPLPKQDMIAIPDFSAGAMENWGLVTYRETALLYDPELSSASNKQRVADVIAHELAHQWFGDLVTMFWWTDLWLNEGFATYMSYLGTESFEPSWKTVDLFVTSELQYVFSMDCLESSHPISVPVTHPDEINQLFDSISYSKGASIIRMMNSFLTEPTFKAGLANYLIKHSYSNAAQDDLWAALTEQGHADGTFPSLFKVKTIMDTWTLQMGYPVIDVEVNSDGTATLSQERFLMVTNPNSTDTHDYKWWVPITFTGQEKPDFTQTKADAWISDMEDSITITGMPAAGNWVIFNLQQKGYYRVNYNTANWQLIIDQLLNDFTVIHVLNRAQIIDDALDLARGGRLSYDIALSVDSYLGNETEYVPWTGALNNLAYLEQMFTRTGGYGGLREYFLSLLTPLYNSVGFDELESDPLMTTYKRTLATSWSCHLDLQDCVTNSVNLFAQWMADPSNSSIISPNMKSTIYCTAIAEGSETEWNFAWEQYQITNLATQKDSILSALGCSKEVWILSRYLEMAFRDGSGIRKQDSARVFGYVADNDIGRDLAWNYLRNNVEMITAYSNSFSMVGSMVERVSNEFNTREDLAELEQFKKDNEDLLMSATQAIEQSIELTNINIVWMDHYYDVIVAWLNNRGFVSTYKLTAFRTDQAHDYSME